MTDHEVALVLPTATDIELLAEEVEVAKGYAERSLSAATRAAYRSDVAEHCHLRFQRYPADNQRYEGPELRATPVDSGRGRNYVCTFAAKYDPIDHIDSFRDSIGAPYIEK